MSNESSPFDKIEKIKEIRSNNKRYSLNLDPSTNDSLVKIKDKLFDIESVKSKISEPKKKSVDKSYSNIEQFIINYVRTN